MTWPPVTLLRGAALPLWALGAAAPAAADAFDCEAGKGHWRDGWSEQKKEWCCSQGSSAGCGGDGGRQAVFRFVGFGDAREARRACKYSAGVAMPKSQGEVDEFKRMLDEARRVGNLTDRWPRNTVWLGGSWDFESKKWQWDDGTDIGKHWAAKNHLDHLGRSGTLQRRDKKEREPWLCTEVMSGPWPAGQWQDSHARHEFGIVCQEWLEATTTRTMVTTTSATDVSLTTGTLVTRPKPFDCRQFRLHWKRAWTDEKKDYCCRTEGVGCIFDCSEGLRNWEEGWSHEKKQWCCEAEDLGCPGISEAEDPLPPLPYDCSAGFANWLMGWSRDKKDWCCTHERRGCKAEGSARAAADAEREREWLAEPEGRQEGQLAATHDCDAGFATWETSWSADKRDWCCTFELRGCPQATQVFAKFSPRPVPRSHGAVRPTFAAMAAVAVGAAAAVAAAASGLWRHRGRASRSPRAAAPRAAGGEPEALPLAPAAAA